MLLENIKLIPRYNWDYGLREWAQSVYGSFFPDTESTDFLETMLGRKAIFTNSGRTSLFAILKALHLPSESGIGVPLFCCPVVFDAICQAGYKPVFIDSNPDDFNISAKDILKKRGSIKAIIAVHMFGRSADMDAILDAAEGIPVIEDCAQSLFSKYKNRWTGSLSSVSFYSFRSGKYISAGEGSFIFSRDETLHDSIQEVVNEFEDWSALKMMLQSSSTYVKSKLYKKPLYGLVGYPIGKKLDQRFNLTAKTGFGAKKIAQSNLTIINNRLKSFHENIVQQRENSRCLIEKISLDNGVLPEFDPEINFYQFPLRLRDVQQRDNLSNFLMKKGIDTAKYLDDIVDIALNKYDYQFDCPIAEKDSKTDLIIPNHYTLSKKDLYHIISSVNCSEKYL